MREVAFAGNKIYANFEVEGVAGTVDQYFAELQAEIEESEQEYRKAVKTTAAGIIISITAYILHFFLF